MWPTNFAEMCLREKSHQSVWEITDIFRKVYRYRDFLFTEIKFHTFSDDRFVSKLIITSAIMSDDLLEDFDSAISEITIRDVFDKGWLYKV